jgi:hypothetical protein
MKYYLSTKGSRYPPKLSAFVGCSTINPLQTGSLRGLLQLFYYVKLRMTAFQTAYMLKKGRTLFLLLEDLDEMKDSYPTSFDKLSKELSKADLPQFKSAVKLDRKRT